MMIQQVHVGDDLVTDVSGAHRAGMCTGKYSANSTVHSFDMKILVASYILTISGDDLVTDGSGAHHTGMCTGKYSAKSILIDVTFLTPLKMV